VDGKKPGRVIYYPATPGGISQAREVAVPAGKPLDITVVYKKNFPFNTMDVIPASTQS
jgi:hypothetical protein